MTRYVVDLAAAVTILNQGMAIPTRHELLAPALLRSQILDHLFQQVRLGRLPPATALSLNARFATLKIRYLGDAVLRRRAWAIASEHAMASTLEAEYLALTQLQADALIAHDRRFARIARKVVLGRPLEHLPVEVMGRQCF